MQMGIASIGTCVLFGVILLIIYFVIITLK